MLSRAIIVEGISNVGKSHAINILASELRFNNQYREESVILSITNPKFNEWWDTMIEGGIPVEYADKTISQAEETSKEVNRLLNLVSENANSIAKEELVVPFSIPPFIGVGKMHSIYPIPYYESLYKLNVDWIRIFVNAFSRTQNKFNLIFDRSFLSTAVYYPNQHVYQSFLEEELATDRTSILTDEFCTKFLRNTDMFPSCITDYILITIPDVGNPNIDKKKPVYRDKTDEHFDKMAIKKRKEYQYTYRNLFKVLSLYHKVHYLENGLSLLDFESDVIDLAKHL